MKSTAPATRAHRTATPAGRSPGLGRRHMGSVVGLLVGAVVMLAVATMDALVGTQVPVLSTLASVPVTGGERGIAARTPPPATPGTCLTWRRADAADAEAVDCNRQHLFEQAGAVRLTDIPEGVPLPDNQRFRQLVNERCTPLVIDYLGGKYDPNGAFRAGALKPSEKSWSEGDRALRCGLQRFSRSGALYAIKGKVRTQDQADVRAAGTCLGVDGRFIGDPVDCSLPHAVESVGAIDLSQKFTGKFPAVGDQDAFLQPACSKLAGDYAGGDKVINDKKLSVLWDNLTPESWAAGSRKVACNLAAQLPDRSGFAPVTGSVKGPVQVGDRPAAPARSPVAPGAPAPGGNAGLDTSPPDTEPPDTQPPDTPPPPAPADGRNDQQSPSGPPEAPPPPVRLPDEPLPGQSVLPVQPPGAAPSGAAKPGVAKPGAAPSVAAKPGPAKPEGG